MSSPRDLRDFMLEHSIFLKFNILMKLYLMQLIQGPSGLFSWRTNPNRVGGWDIVISHLQLLIQFPLHYTIFHCL